MSFTVLMAVSARYGWHRDELYFFQAGQRLAWGYVDFPPLVAAVARLTDTVFGASLVGLRSVPALAIAVVVLLTARLAAAFGGDRRARLVAALGAGLCPVFLGVGHLLATTTFELVAWALITLLLTRLLSGANERLWLLMGVVIGAGFLAKHSMVFIVAAIAGAVLLSGSRRLLVRGWVLAGAGVAIALALPNVVWQARHDWPVFEMLASLRSQSGVVDSVTFVPAQIGMTGLTAILWLPGLWWLLRGGGSHPWKPLGVSYLLLVAWFVGTGGKPYYLVGMYPVLLAAGAVWWEQRGSMSVPLATVLVGSLGIVIAIPILPPEQAARIPIPELQQEFGAQLGWERLVEEVAAAHEILGPGDAAVVTSNYGQAGAVDRYGPDRGLPRAQSPHNNYWLWGPPAEASDRAVLVGFPEEQVHAWFARCTLTWRFETPHGVPGEEEGRPLWACTGQRRSWAELWPEMRRYEA